MRKGFKHRTEIRVRNYEVDWQGIVHNANYLRYFEVGRIEYLRALGIRIDLESVSRDSRVVLVRNEIDYRSPARFDDLLAVYTRIITIGDTSFTFGGAIEEVKSRRLIAENIAVHVWLDPATNAPVRVGRDFRRKVKNFERRDLSAVAPEKGGRRGRSPDLLF